MKRGRFICATAIIAAGIAVVIVFFLMRNHWKNNTTNNIEDKMADVIKYQEVEAQYGTLREGVTKSASVSLKIASQTFDWNIHSLDNSALQVEKVLVSAGQQIQKGTALFRATPESVQRVRAVLQREILDTNRAYEILQARQKELCLQASQRHDSDITDGKYAHVVYSDKCDALQKKADDAKKAVDEKQNQINENLLELAQAQQELVQAQRAQKEAEIAVSETYRARYDNAYYYSVYENTREKTKRMVGALEKEIENLTKTNESLLFEVDEAVRTYHQVVQDLDRARLAAKRDYDSEVYDSQIASKQYEIQTIPLDNAVRDARKRYEAALRKIRVFDACIVQNKVLSVHNGIVSDVAVKEGDTLHKNDILVTFYDQDTATVTAMLSEEEYLALCHEKTVNIRVADCPDKIYTGIVTEISNTEENSSSSKACIMVTVAIQGNCEGLCAGGLCDITFLTDKSQEGIYVPSKAVFTKGKRSCVRVRGQDGEIIEKTVTIGCSDGMNTKIIDGIFEGDIVLIPLFPNKSFVDNSSYNRVYLYMGEMSDGGTERN